ncbi:MAG: glutamine-hydrolyzing carbamoyl-phosphate synthase small subunit [Acidobacteriota bacterium]|nr:MAG: glutamine-hydrolyzing carbamoyl-phosphate synthase small subunit [Acidobacteriota bacterium]
MEALLALEDGRVFRGNSLGAAGVVTGEVVFNTGMTGYQEILTDPSYRGQIVTLTVPHVGNTGWNSDDPESDRPQASGLVVRAATRFSSSWRSRGDLDHYLRQHGVVGIEEIDTRALTRHLRSAGVLRGCLSASPLTAEQAIERARSAPRIEDQDLVAQVTCQREFVWREGRGAVQDAPSTARGRGYHVVALDFGVKRNILRLLVERGFRVTVVPAHTSASDALALRPDGVFLSNGPGDPSVLRGPIETIRELIGRVPIFGICLGHQLIALACGGRTYKLKFGHRGVNHPVREEATGRVAISSQNHGYAVSDEDLPEDLVVTHRSLYDGTVEGLAHRRAPLFCVQFHPEAAPGPHDSWDLFDRFVDLIEKRRPLTIPARLRSA